VDLQLVCVSISLTRKESELLIGYQRPGVRSRSIDAPSRVDGAKVGPKPSRNRIRNLVAMLNLVNDSRENREVHRVDNHQL
jgi:hypothetical protein